MEDLLKDLTNNEEKHDKEEKEKLDPEKKDNFFNYGKAFLDAINK